MKTATITNDEITTAQRQPENTPAEYIYIHSWQTNNVDSKIVRGKMLKLHQFVQQLNFKRKTIVKYTIADRIQVQRIAFVFVFVYMRHIHCLVHLF